MALSALPSLSAAISARTLPSRAVEGRAEQQPSTEHAHADEIRRLKARDAEVRAHEQAHAAAGGMHAGAPSYTFERGPDGRSYAVSGEVQIDVAAVSNNPEATIQKMMQVKRAALAPQSPSDADRAIAAMADAKIAAARLELNRAEAAATYQSATGPAPGSVIHVVS